MLGATRLACASKTPTYAADWPTSKPATAHEAPEGQPCRGSSFAFTYSSPSGPIADTWETYSPDLAQWK